MITQGAHVDIIDTPEVDQQQRPGRVCESLLRAVPLRTAVEESQCGPHVPVHARHPPRLPGTDLSDRLCGSAVGARITQDGVHSGVRTGVDPHRFEVPQCRLRARRLVPGRPRALNALLHAFAYQPEEHRIHGFELQHHRRPVLRLPLCLVRDGVSSAARIDVPEVLRDQRGVHGQPFARGPCLHTNELTGFQGVQHLRGNEFQRALPVNRAGGGDERQGIVLLRRQTRELPAYDPLERRSPQVRDRDPCTVTQGDQPLHAGDDHHRGQDSGHPSGFRIEPRHRARLHLGSQEFAGQFPRLFDAEVRNADGHRRLPRRQRQPGIRPDAAVEEVVHRDERDAKASADAAERRPALRVQPIPVVDEDDGLPSCGHALQSQHLRPGSYLAFSGPACGPQRLRQRVDVLRFRGVRWLQHQTLPPCFRQRVGQLSEEDGAAAAEPTDEIHVETVREVSDDRRDPLFSTDCTSHCSPASIVGGGPQLSPIGR